MYNNTKRNKNISLANLFLGYTLSVIFIILLMSNVNSSRDSVEIITRVVEVNNTIVEDRLVYTPSHAPSVQYVDHLDVGINKSVRHDWIDRNPNQIGINTVDVDSIHSRTWNGGSDPDIVAHDINTHKRDTNNHSRRSLTRRLHSHDVLENHDPGLLDRRIQQMEDDEIGLSFNDGVDISNLTVAGRGDDMELGDVMKFHARSKAGDVAGGGQLFAYSFPSQGVGAGVGSGSVGATSGGGAGIGAGIGEAITGGDSVPTLGGVGTYMNLGNAPDVGGVGGLVAGGGAGGAAGLYTGKVIEVLGINPGPGTGASEGYNYDHLPRDGALHIMMHVDGSGSILNTRKQLDIMKDTLLKRALLPYYNNDVDLYNRRVTIVSTSGERTLQFFKEAAEKDNVLAIAFQDEAQPAYHLPNFNKQPEEHYLDDINELKASLDGYTGLYRGVMFQVDRGKTFAKSFKEFVNNSFKGEGYLESSNLKNYYRDNNTDNIRNKDGIVFSDEYHAKDSGDPTYYLNLILTAAKRVGLDLSVNSGRLTDGKNI